MTLEKVFLIVAFSILSALAMYEIIYIFFVKGAAERKNKKDEEGPEMMNIGETAFVVQPKPLGYCEPSAQKYEICPSPVIALPCEVNTPQIPIEPSEPTESIHTPHPRKNSVGKAPIIVVSSEIV